MLRKIKKEELRDRQSGSTIRRKDEENQIIFEDIHYDYIETEFFKIGRAHV